MGGRTVKHLLYLDTRKTVARKQTSFSWALKFNPFPNRMVQSFFPVLFGSAQNVQTSKNGTFKNVLEVYVNKSAYSIIEDVQPDPPPPPPPPECHMHELMSVRPIKSKTSPFPQSKSSLASQTTKIDDYEMKSSRE